MASSFNVSSWSFFVTAAPPNLKIARTGIVLSM